MIIYEFHSFMVKFRINASLKKNIRSQDGRKLCEKSLYAPKSGNFYGIQPPKESESESTV